MTYPFFPYVLPDDAQRLVICLVMQEAEKLSVMAGKFGLPTESSGLKQSSRRFQSCLEITSGNPSVEHPKIPILILRENLNRVRSSTIRGRKRFLPLMDEVLKLEVTLRTLTLMYPPRNKSPYLKEFHKQRLAEWSNPPLALVLRFGRSIDWFSEKIKEVKWAFLRFLSGGK